MPFRLRSSTSIQGDILAAFKKKHIAFLLIDYGFDATDTQPGRDWIKDMLNRKLISTTADIVNARGDNETKAIWTNLSFTFDGLKGLDPQFDHSVPPELKAFRAGGSSDRTINKLQDKREDLKTGSLLGELGVDVKAVIKVAAEDSGDLNKRIDLLKQIAETHNVKVREVVPGDTLTRDGKTIEAGFQFRDGVSQPRVLDYHEGGDIQAGEFIVGLAKQSIEPPSSPGWMRDGSFMVLRKLQQDPDKWATQLQLVAKQLAASFGRSVSTDEVAEILIGRAKNGKELDDKQQFSHVFKMNSQGPGSNQRRIIRRGVPYKDGAEIGLLFNAYMADIEEQFEFLQSEWANNSDQPVISKGPDPVIGNAQEPFEVRVTKDLGCPVQLHKMVRSRGTLYTFVPSLDLLTNIAMSQPIV